MPDNTDDHVAMMFHGLVSDLQRNDVAAFDAEQKKQREAAAALRAEQPYQGLTAGELIKKMQGDPEQDRKKVEDDIARIEREAKTTVEKKDKVEALPSGHFPPPPTSG